VLPKKYAILCWHVKSRLSLVIYREENFVHTPKRRNHETRGKTKSNQKPEFPHYLAGPGLPVVSFPILIQKPDEFISSRSARVPVGFRLHVLNLEKPRNYSKSPGQPWPAVCPCSGGGMLRRPEEYVTVMITRRLTMYSVLLNAL
jgi:hypothetical protein